MPTGKHGYAEDSSNPTGIVAEKSALRRKILSARNSLDDATRARKSETICGRLCAIYDEAANTRRSTGKPESKQLFQGEREGQTRRENGFEENPGPDMHPELRGRITVCVYRAFGSEVDLDAFVEHVWNSGGIVAFPCMEKAAVVDSLVEPGKGHGRIRRSRMTMRTVSREAYEESAGGNKDTAPFLYAVAKSFDPDDERLSGFAVVEPEEVGMVVVPLVAYDDKGGRLGYGGGNYDEFLDRIRPDAIVVGVGFAEQRVERVPRETHDISIPRIVSA